MGKLTHFNNQSIQKKPEPAVKKAAEKIVNPKGDKKVKVVIKK
jgi:hypothetical protein